MIATELYIYRLRNYKDIECYLDETSAIYDKKTLLELYKIATDEPYSFLYFKLTDPDKRRMFFKNLKDRLHHILTKIKMSEDFVLRKKQKWFKQNFTKSMTSTFLHLSCNCNW